MLLYCFFTPLRLFLLQPFLQHQPQTKSHPLFWDGFLLVCHWQLAQELLFIQENPSVVIFSSAANNKTLLDRVVKRLFTLAINS